MIGTGQVRVAIVDSYQLLVDALRLVILMQEDMTIVGTGSTYTECLELVRQTRPQVLLLEGELLEQEGVALAQAIRVNSPTTNILMLTTASDEEWLLQAMLSWVCGCISRRQNLAEVLNAIRAAAPGKAQAAPAKAQAAPGKAQAAPAKALVAPAKTLAAPDKVQASAVTAAMLADQKIAALNLALPNHASSGKDALTRREGEILALLARGKTAKEIAEHLMIAPLTVRTHIRNLLQKLGCRSQLQAVAYGYSNGLIERI